MRVYDHLTAYRVGRRNLPDFVASALWHMSDYNGWTACGVGRGGSPANWWITPAGEAPEDARVCSACIQAVEAHVRAVARWAKHDAATAAKRAQIVAALRAAAALVESGAGALSLADAETRFITEDVTTRADTFQVHRATGMAETELRVIISHASGVHILGPLAAYAAAPS